MNNASWFLLAWCAAATLLAYAEFTGALVPRSCVATQVANGQDQDLLNAVTEARRR